MTRSTKVIQFIEKFCLTPEGADVGKPLKLLPFQKRFIKDIYDNPAGTSRAYLSVARKNGKSALIAAILLAHIAGPEARTNSQIISGARSRDQASLVFKLAEKMVRLSPLLSQLIKVVPSQKSLIGLARNVEYKAISAEAGTAHGLSPVLAILDEVGQVRGPTDAFVEAIETAQGAHADPLLIAISTQAATDGDLFSVWLDDAQTANDRRSSATSTPRRRIANWRPQGVARGKSGAWQISLAPGHGGLRQASRAAAVEGKQLPLALPEPADRSGKPIFEQRRMAGEQ
jgi:phage terminase large subunit-like protein